MENNFTYKKGKGFYSIYEIIKKLLRFICISKQRLILSKESDFNTKPSLDSLVCYRTNTYTLYIRVH